MLRYFLATGDQVLGAFSERTKTLSGAIGVYTSLV